MIVSLPFNHKLFMMEAMQVLNILKMYAMLLKYQHADALMWKAMRAGKTMALAAHGITLPELKRWMQLQWDCPKKTKM